MARRRRPNRTPPSKTSASGQEEQRRANRCQQSVCPKSGCRIKTRPPSRTRRPRTRYRKFGLRLRSANTAATSTTKAGFTNSDARVKTIRSAPTVRAFDSGPTIRSEPSTPETPRTAPARSANVARTQQEVAKISTSDGATKLICDKRNRTARRRCDAQPQACCQRQQNACRDQYRHAGHRPAIDGPPPARQHATIGTR